MNEVIERVYDEARSAWRYRWIGLAVAAVSAVVAWAVVFALPDRYEARASVFVDTRSALKPVLQGLTVEQDLNAQLNYVRQSLFTGEQLVRIAEEAGLFANGRGTDPRQRAQILETLGSSVRLEVRSAGGRDSDPQSAGAVYTFSYQDVERDRTLKVVQTVEKNFIEQTLGGKRAGSESAQKFLEAQIQSYEERLREAENKLAAFKKENLGLMPTEQGDYFAQLQAETDAARKASNDLGLALSRRAELARQLRGESVIGASAATVGSGNAAAGDTVSRIKEAQARLDELLLRFTDKHPDVIAARGALEELKARREKEIESLRRGDANAVAQSGVSSNPVYQNIMVQLNQADVDIASLRGLLAQHQAKAEELKKRLDVAPKVEAEFAQLNRDYDSNKALYAALLANYEKARLGERADSAGSVRFEEVQPPTAPFSPVSPHRSVLLAAILVLSSALGAGVTYLLHQLNPVVASVRGLTELASVQVLGVVSAAFPDQLRSNARRDLLWFTAAYCMLGGLFVLSVVLNYAGVRLNIPVLGAN